MSLKIYLSGAKVPNQPSEPSTSLGQYPSNVEIQNNLIGNLFGDLSRYVINLNRPEVRAIVIKNTGSTTITGLRVWFEYPDDGESEPTETNDCEFDIQYVNLVTDDCGDVKFPASVSSQFATPYNIQLQSDVVGEDNALSLPNIESAGLLGIWLRRRLKSTTQQPMSDDDLIAVLEGTLDLPKQEDIKIIFEWDD